MEELPLGIDGKRGRFFVMKGTAADKTTTDPPQFNMLADHLDDISGVLNGLFYLITISGNRHGLPHAYKERMIEAKHDRDIRIEMLSLRYFFA
jgi:hypothetical protein